MERAKVIDKRICSKCESTITYVDKRNISQWYKHNNKTCCKKCYNKLFVSTETRKRTINFKSKSRTYVGFIPRREVCSNCGMKKGDKYTVWGKEKIVKIHLHHIKYHDDDPLKDTIELCARCHIYVTMDDNEKWGRPCK